MNIWDILEISSDVSISEVKRAYAKKLKQHRPEEDPEGFQRLKAAYDIALEQIKGRTEPRQETSGFQGFTDEALTGFMDNIAYSEESTSSLAEDTDRLREFMDKVESIYAEVKSRNDVNQWKALLNDEVLWNLEDRSLLGSFC